MTGRPPWLDHLVEQVDRGIAGEWFSAFLPPDGGGRRQSAVLMLFGPPSPTDPPGDARVLLTERAHTMRSHAGQAAFPGGGREPEDENLTRTALREAQEEVGLDPGGVRVLTHLPTLHIPVSGYDVTPVLGWWERPTRVWAREPHEVERVVNASVAHLLEPENRVRVRHPSGFVGPGFVVDELLVWGFTAGLLDRTLHLAGLTRDWDRRRVVDLPG